MRLVSPTDSIFSIWNSSVGRGSFPSTQGDYSGQYPINKDAVSAIDQIMTTKYVNYGYSNKTILTVSGGLDSGFYVTTSLNTSPILTRFRIGTANDRPFRDPLVVTLEGSNGGDLTQGESWTLIYNGSTGLEIDPGRESFGPFQSILNFKSFSSYRFLTVSKRSIDDSVQYSEVEFYGHLLKSC